jgi:hypothetical protein
VDTKKLVVVLVLVLVAMLFVIALAAGAGRGNGDTDNPPGIVDSLKGLQSSNFLTADDVSTCTKSGVTLVVPCAIVIPPRGRFSGPTRVALDVPEGGSEVSVAVNPANSRSYDMKIKPKECGETALDRKGGTLLLTCRQLSPTKTTCAAVIRTTGCGL